MKSYSPIKLNKIFLKMISQLSQNNKQIINRKVKIKKFYTKFKNKKVVKQIIMVKINHKNINRNIKIKLY